LGGRKGIRPVKNRVVGYWRGYSLERGADLHMAQLMPLPLTVSCSSKIQIGLTFLVPAYPVCPGKEAIKWLLLPDPWKHCKQLYDTTQIGLLLILFQCGKK